MHYRRFQFVLLVDRSCWTWWQSTPVTRHVRHLFVSTLASSYIHDLGFIQLRNIFHWWDVNQEIICFTQRGLTIVIVIIFTHLILLLLVARIWARHIFAIWFLIMHHHMLTLTLYNRYVITIFIEWRYIRHLKVVWISNAFFN